MSQGVLVMAWPEIEKEADNLRRAARNRNQKELQKALLALQSLNRVLQNFGMTWNLKQLFMVCIKDNEAFFDRTMSAEEARSRSSKTTLGVVLDAIDSDAELFPGFQANVKDIADELDKLITKNGRDADTMHFLTLADWQAFDPKLGEQFNRMLGNPHPKS